MLMMVHCQAKPDDGLLSAFLTTLAATAPSLQVRKDEHAFWASMSQSKAQHLSNMQVQLHRCSTARPAIHCERCATGRILQCSHYTCELSTMANCRLCAWMHTLQPV